VGDGFEALPEDDQPKWLGGGEGAAELAGGDRPKLPALIGRSMPKPLCIRLRGRDVVKGFGSTISDELASFGCGESIRYWTNSAPSAGDARTRTCASGQVGRPREREPFQRHERIRGEREFESGRKLGDGSHWLENLVLRVRC